MTKKQSNRNQLIVELYEKHRSLRTVGKLVNLSYERIRQILQAEKLSTSKKLDTPDT